MRYLIGPAMLSVLGWVAFASAFAPPVKPDSSARLEEWIRKLGDDNHQEREAATRALREAGPDVLPLLRQALSDADPEVRRRVAEIIPGLEAANALAPTMVSLDVEKLTIQQIFEELGRKTGFKFQQWGGADAQRPFTFHLDRVPFWKAIDEISQTCGLVLQQSYGDEWLRFQQQDAFVPHLCYDGPFRFVANSFQYYRNINLNQLPRNSAPSQPTESLTFSFSIFSEPKLPLLGVGQPVLEVATDQDKRSMLPTVGNQANDITVRRSFNGGYRSYHQQASVTLNPQGDRSRSLKVLKGTIPVMVLLEQKPEVVTDKILAAKGKDFKMGSVRFAIEDVVEEAGPRYQIKMNITNDEGKATPNDYSWQNSLHQRIEVHDAEGNKFQNNGSSWGGSGAGQVNMTLHYVPPGNVKAGKPSKLIYYNWKTLQHQLTFEFKDLPLP